uniref:Cellulose synthase operon protein C n=1 Tax=Lygus hesperus TaxID=30085 RepID=A0A0A9Y142_LYGHE
MPTSASPHPALDSVGYCAHSRVEVRTGRHSLREVFLAQSRCCLPRQQTDRSARYLQNTVSIAPNTLDSPPPCPVRRFSPVSVLCTVMQSATHPHTLHSVSWSTVGMDSSTIAAGTTHRAVRFVVASDATVWGCVSANASATTGRRPQTDPYPAAVLHYPTRYCCTPTVLRSLATCAGLHPRLQVVSPTPQRSTHPRLTAPHSHLLFPHVLQCHNCRRYRCVGMRSVVRCSHRLWCQLLLGNLQTVMVPSELLHPLTTAPLMLASWMPTTIHQHGHPATVAAMELNLILQCPWCTTAAVD